MKKLNLYVLTALIAVMTTPVVSHAQSKSSGKESSKDSKETGSTSSSSSSDRGSDKLDIQKLENQYWSAKDDDFTVVQNRSFTKAHKFFASAMYGSIINDPNIVGNPTSFSAGYYFSERWGVEFTHMNFSTKNSDAVQNYIDNYKTSPDVNTLKSANTLSAVVVPFYAKMSLLEKMILYFDMSVGLGIGQTNYDMQYSAGSRAVSSSHTELDITQQFFINNRFAFRFSIKNQFVKEDRLLYSLKTGQTEPTALDSKNIQNTQMLLGVTFFVDSPIGKKD